MQIDGPDVRALTALGRTALPGTWHWSEVLGAGGDLGDFEWGRSSNCRTFRVGDTIILIRKSGVRHSEANDLTSSPSGPHSHSTLPETSHRIATRDAHPSPQGKAVPTIEDHSRCDPFAL